jgi:hypothetical protein
MGKEWMGGQTGKLIRETLHDIDVCHANADGDDLNDDNDDAYKFNFRRVWVRVTHHTLSLPTNCSYANATILPDIAGTNIPSLLFQAVSKR